MLRRRRDDRVRWQSRKPTSRTQPRTHPRGQSGRCAGSSAPASWWTTQIRRARNASGTATRVAGWIAQEQLLKPARAATPGGGLDFLVSPALLHRQR